MIVKPITDFVNRMIDERKFPTPMEYALVNPINKINDTLNVKIIGQ